MFLHHSVIAQHCFHRSCFPYTCQTFISEKQACAYYIDRHLKRSYGLSIHHCFLPRKHTLFQSPGHQILRPKRALCSSKRFRYRSKLLWVGMFPSSILEIEHVDAGQGHISDTSICLWIEHSSSSHKKIQFRQLRAGWSLWHSSCSSYSSS